MAKKDNKSGKMKRKTPPSQRARADGKRGVRSTEVEHAQRLRVLEDMLASCMPWNAILEDLTGRFDVGEPTVYKWATEIRDRWAREEEVLRPQRKAVYRARLDALYRRSWVEGDLLICVQVAKLQAGLDGLNAPTRLQISGRVEVSALTPEQRRKEIDALLERRRLAAAAAKRPMIEAKATEH